MEESGHWYMGNLLYRRGRFGSGFDLRPLKVRVKEPYAPGHPVRVLVEDWPERLSLGEHLPLRDALIRLALHYPYVRWPP